jgi:hypothetical protein
VEKAAAKEKAEEEGVLSFVQIVMKVDTLRTTAPKDQTQPMVTTLAMMALLLRAYGAKKCTGAMHVLSQHSADHREYV